MEAERRPCRDSPLLLKTAPEALERRNGTHLSWVVHVTPSILRPRVLRHQTRLDMHECFGIKKVAHIRREVLVAGLREGILAADESKRGTLVAAGMRGGTQLVTDTRGRSLLVTDMKRGGDAMAICGLRRGALVTTGLRRRGLDGTGVGSRNMVS